MTAFGAAALVVTMMVPQAAQPALASQSTHAAGLSQRARGAPPGQQAADSGTDASCPAASPSAANSATVTAPTQVRAIAGKSSATVVWCPPASGAGSVTSYTVTSSGGQQVTATVPNDWAIVDGLSNGTSYTFTVKADTSGGTSRAAASSSQVTPAPIAAPPNVMLGQPQTISYDSHSMIIGGKRVFITAGEFDPWRTPSPSLWLDDLQKMKADGYNAVTAYFDWDYHSPAPGSYDFTGVRDINQFLNDAQQAGLYVIARPGPYINAETDGGGIPSWVLTSPNGYRIDHEPYLSAALQWYSQVDPIIAAHQVTKGGNVIAYQIENEYTTHGHDAEQYMADLEQQVRSDGIGVPLTFNQCCGAETFTSGLGAVNISGTDNYPVGFNCANTNSFGNPYGYPSYQGEPIYLPEYQGGSFDGWGGTGYDNCYTMTGPPFENVYYKNNIARGATMQSNYMGVGGTNWGWLPANFIYSSYDYGAAIRETGEIGTNANPGDITGSKFGENKLINDFETSAAPLTDTTAATAPKADNPAVTTMARANPQDGTQFVYLRQADARSTATVSTHIALTADGTSYPAVPQQGTITLQGRDSRMLVAGYSFAGQQLVYSTSELATQASIGGRAVALLYDPKGTDGETVLRYASQPTVKVLSGSAQASWDAGRGDLRLDYTHGGLTEVAVSGGGRPPLLLMLAGTNTAEGFWPEQTSAGPVLVQGGYLVRTATVHGADLALAGDTSKSGPLAVWAPPAIRSVTWNGQQVTVKTAPDGSMTGTVGGPAPVSLPALGNWRFAPGAPEAQPGYDDSSWTLADHPVSNAKPRSTPVLYASDYGYDHGFAWYRGHFTGTGGQTGITLTGDGMSPTGAYSVWLNGAFLGSASASGAQARTFTFPPGAVRSGKDNVVAVLIENTGNPEGPSGEKAGLYSAALTGSPAPITWKLMGNKGGTTLQDPVRGVMNPAGLYGSNHGWDLPGYLDQNWQQVSLPDTWSSRGIPPGIGWYRTNFSLSMPAHSYVPIDVQIGGPGPGAGTADYRAFIYVNGWMVGRYVNNVGPQHQFYVPAGILNDHGGNTLAIAVWGMDSSGGGLGKVSLAAAGNQAGGIPISKVTSPAYNAATYGTPASPQPTPGRPTR